MLQHFHTECCIGSNGGAGGMAVAAGMAAHNGWRVMEKQGGFNMLRLTVSTEEYLMIGDDVRIVFLGGSHNHLKIMIDAPKEVDVIRSRVIENKIKDPELKAKFPKYYAEPDRQEKFRKSQKICK